MRYGVVLTSLLLLTVAIIGAWSTHAALIDQVNSAFREVHGRTPTFSEWEYWAQRVQNGDKQTYEALVGAIAYQNIHGSNATASATATTLAAGSFKVSSTLYPSPYGPNLLPDGTLIRSTSNTSVYYVQGGKRSWVLPSILNLWLQEAHFFNSSVVVTLSPEDFARYPQTASRNPLYIGKVLVHPTGQQYYIDDKLRKRPLSAAVRTALKFPAGNKYATSAAHLQEFPTGPALTGSLQPGGMIIYDGPYHGGRIWRLQEASDGVITKRLYLGDRFYEAEYYPDESQRVGVSETELARYRRGANIGTYPKGWLVGINGKIFVVQGGKLRHITSPSIFAAMGYTTGNVQLAFQEFVTQIPQGTPITAFKTIVVATAGTAPTTTTTTTSSTAFPRVRPAVRSLMLNLNNIYLTIFDKDVTPEENTFWLDYIYAGEAQTLAELEDAMRTARSTGQKPGRTCRTCEIDQNKLKDRWLPYLFYYTWLKEPTAADTAYWRAQVDAGRNTIQRLDSNIQWLKQSENKTSK